MKTQSGVINIELASESEQRIPTARLQNLTTPERERMVRKKPSGAREKKSFPGRIQTPLFLHAEHSISVKNIQRRDMATIKPVGSPMYSSCRTEIPRPQVYARAHTSKDIPSSLSSLVTASGQLRGSDEGVYLSGDDDGPWGTRSRSPSQDVKATVHATHTGPLIGDTDRARLSGRPDLHDMMLEGSSIDQADHETLLRNPLGTIGRNHLTETGAPLGLPIHANPSHENPSTGSSETRTSHQLGGDRSGWNEAGHTWGIGPLGWGEDDGESSDDNSDSAVGSMVPASVWEGAPAWDLMLGRGTNGQNVDWEVPLDYTEDREFLSGDSGTKSRIEWYFAPNQDERVSSLLVWVGMMKDRLGVFGLCKFLRSQQRGALFTHADCRSERDPQLPGFDWISFDDLQQTDDKFIRDSVSYYRPAVQVVIFITLPLITGDRVAMWRRTIEIPDKVQLMFEREIKLVINGLWDQEVKLVEEGRGVLNYVATTPKKVLGRRRPQTPRGQSPHSTRPPQSLNATTDGVIRYESNIYQILSYLIRQEIGVSPPGRSLDRIRKALQTACETSASLNNLPALQLSRSYQYRAQLMEICSDLGIVDSPSVRKALQDDERHISLLLQQMLAVKDFGRKAVLRLQRTDAESFADLLQMALDRYQMENPSFWRGARRLLVKLSEVSGVIPKSLMIHGISLLEKEAVFGGGFADIYRALYKNQEVAVKRMRVFQRGQDRHKIHRTFCKEALLWKSFHHPHVLPFYGVDSKTFSPYLCMVSPWMQHGTIMRHLSENEGVDVNKLLREVAQGLNYLHSQKVVHGDLRGSNILINDEWQACLADFGLTAVSDTTLGTQTSNSHGSVRWMAPELHDPESFGFTRFIRTFASDMYAFGCVCFEVYTGRPPFADIANDSAVMLQVLRGVRPQRDVGRRVPDDVWRLVEQCWKETASERLDIHEVVDIMNQWQ